MIILEPKWKSWIVETTTPLFTPKQCEWRKKTATTKSTGGHG